MPSSVFKSPQLLPTDKVDHKKQINCSTAAATFPRQRGLHLGISVIVPLLVLYPLALFPHLSVRNSVLTPSAPPK